ncbi:MAG: hypothetical protein QW566_10020, partial [Candidatus Jordarchaeales archaeon]
SPYFPHRNCTGVDIYPNLEFGENAPSPVSGEVVAIKEVDYFEDRGFGCSKVDYLVILRSLENKERFIKILHVKPSVDIGDEVAVGGRIGALIRSGFFDFWTDPHIHVEVRKPFDPIRARGGLRFERLVAVDDVEVEFEELRGTVVESKKQYSLIVLNGNFRHGIPVNVGEEVGILDGGVPHYGWFGVHMKTRPLPSSVVKFCGTNIGTVKAIYLNMCVAQCSGLTFKLNEKPVKLSLYLYLSTPLIKVIPINFGELELRKFENVVITIS